MQTLAAGTVAAFVAAGGVVTYIKRDGGGDVFTYSDKYDQMYAKGEKVVISGNCYSACTMLLGYPNACLDPTAVLGFHPSYTPYVFGLLSYKVSAIGTDHMKRYYPPDALEVINKHHGLEDHGGWFFPSVVLIPASEFPARYHCK
jgi:hypothetical protein